MVVKDRTQVERDLERKGIKDYTILEERELIWVLTKEGALKYVKMRSHAECMSILNLILPPTYIKTLPRLLKKPIRNKAYKTAIAFLKTHGKRNLFMLGSVGCGKTSNCTFVLYHLLRKRQIHNPLYVPVACLGFEEEINRRVIEADSFLVDDLNLSVPEYHKKIATSVMLYALENQYPLLVTSNNTWQELCKGFFQQHLVSRIESSSLIVQIKDKDYRLSHSS